jgi:imidazolonepropionase-like amidohydrolase
LTRRAVRIALAASAAGGIAAAPLIASAPADLAGETPRPIRTGDPQPGRAVAFTHVAVVPMDRERVIEDQTVLVRDGRIVVMGDAASVEVPDDALRVDGRGRWLMPGLADMHTHLFSDGSWPDSLAADELAVMVANGVTTARLMIGTPEHLALRERVAAGEVLGPTLHLASPQLSGKAHGDPFHGRVVTTPDEARAAVLELADAGYDFVKLTYFISRPVYDAAVAAAAEAGIPVVGHVDREVGLARALEAGQQIEHLDGYVEALLPDDAPGTRWISGLFLFQPASWESLDAIRWERVEEVARATALAGVWNTPTLTFFELAFGTGRPEEEIRSSSDFAFVPDALRSDWFEGGKGLEKMRASPERRRRYVEARDRITKAIHDAGGKLLAGSDTPEWFLLYGWTLHRELRNLVDAGLSPYAALETATRNPAEWLGELNEAGTVAVGKRADLLLLEADPLEDVANAERRAGVMLRGRWLPEEELRGMLDRMAPRFRAVPLPGAAS